MKFACSHCGQHIDAEDKWAGQQVNCPNCKHVLSVPHSSDPLQGAEVQGRVITFDCVKCGQCIEIDERGAGRQVKCPQCGQNLTVPIADSVPKTAVPTETIASARASNPSQLIESRRNWRALIGWIIGGLAAIIALIALVNFLIGGAGSSIPSLAGRGGSGGEVAGTGRLKASNNSEINRMIPIEKKTTFQKTIFTEPQYGHTLALISETECEFNNGGRIVLAEYSRQDNMLRIVRRGIDGASVSYFEIWQEGLKEKSGREVFLLPESLKQYHEKVRIAKEAEAARQKALAEERMRAKNEEDSRRQRAVSEQSDQFRNRLSTQTGINGAWLGYGSSNWTKFRLTPLRFDQQTGIFAATMEVLDYQPYGGAVKKVDNPITKVEGKMTQGEITFEEVASIRLGSYVSLNKKEQAQWWPSQAKFFSFQLAGEYPIKGKYTTKSGVNVELEAKIER